MIKDAVKSNKPVRFKQDNPKRGKSFERYERYKSKCSQIFGYEKYG